MLRASIATLSGSVPPVPEIMQSIYLDGGRIGVAAEADGKVLAERQIEQIHRRVIMGEEIPHHEKVFSIFEEHTEWIVKGKAGCPQELGLRVCMVESRQGFILHYQVMQQQTDDQVTVSIIAETKEQYPELAGCSFDKGFHSQSNQERLKELLDRITMPKKGKLSAADKVREYDPTFQDTKRQHSAVESAAFDIKKILPEEKQAVIEKTLESVDHNSLKPVKEALGDDYSYDEIKMVLALRQYQSRNPTDGNN
jgi:hypothetical protein